MIYWSDAVDGSRGEVDPRGSDGGEWQPTPLHLPLDERPRRRPHDGAPSDSSQPSSQDDRPGRVIVIDIA